MAETGRITLVAAPGSIIAVLAEVTTTILNPEDLPGDEGRAAQAIANTSCDVVVLSDDLDVDRALAAASAVADGFPEIEVVWLAPTEPFVLAAAMGAGIRLVLAPGTDAGDMRASVQRVAMASARRRERLGAGGSTSDNLPSDGRVITVMAAKGGTGKTTIAVNVAVALARQHPRQVVLVDLDVMAGDADLLLDIEPSASLASVALDGMTVDAASTKLALCPHPSGLLVLTAPETLVEAAAIDPALLVGVIETLRSSFSFVVIDTPPGAGSELAAAAEVTDDLVAVATADLGGLRSLRRNLDAFDALSITSHQRHLVLNRADYRTGLGADAVEAAVDLPIALAVPECREIPIAANQGVPFVTTTSRAEALKALTMLAARLDPSSQRETTPGSGLGATPAPGPARAGTGRDVGNGFGAGSGANRQARV